MNKINANVLTVRIKGRGVYLFRYDTPIRGDYFENISNNSELYDEWNSKEYPSQILIRRCINEAKLGTHYSKDGSIIE